MEWGTISDYMNSFLGAAFLFIGLIAIPEIRKKKRYWIPILAGIIILVVIGIDKINRDNKEKGEMKRNISDLREGVGNIRKGKTQDSIIAAVKEYKHAAKDSEFQKRLFDEFRITRDSTNRPKQVNYNTKIDKARDVFIGGN